MGYSQRTEAQFLGVSMSANLPRDVRRKRMRDGSNGGLPDDESRGSEA